MHTEFTTTSQAQERARSATPLRGRSPRARAGRDPRTRLAVDRLRARAAEQGLTLVEILVAVAILAVAVVIALTVYDLSRKSFKRGENLTEQQQGVRIAFDRMSADLRMAGYNYNPDGASNRTDEQIEAAYDTAVVVRGDYDAEDPVDSTTPESALVGGAFLSVSTGNDEIVAYVLAKDDGTSPGTLRFRADISSPRDGVEELISVPNVAMVQDDPPYTLYRVTFNNDSTTFGGASFVVRTPLIDNVYSMNFRYFNQVNVQQNNVFDLTSVAEDIGGLDTGTRRTERASIRRIGLELTGLTPEPDPGFDWVDADDPYPATEKHRKFDLASDVTPRNLGKIGVQDIAADLVPPSQPGAPSLTPGHCGGLFVNWPDNPTNDGVAYYRINSSTTAGSIGAVRTATSSSYYLNGLNDATTYYISIQAVDAAGNISIKSTEVSAATNDVNTPSAPANLLATTTLNSAVSTTWDAVTTNTAALPAADPAAPRIRDLAGYRVYRSTGTAFGGATLIADESVVTPSVSPDHPDTEVVNCRSYNYWVTAVDRCGNESTESNMATGNSTTSTLPKAPENVQAFLQGFTSADVQWAAVEADVSDKKIFIDRYRVYRTDPLPIGIIPTSDSQFRFLTEVQGVLKYTDNPPIAPGVTTVFYKISAIDDCGNESALSAAAEPSCSFTGDLVFTTPADGSPVAGVVPIGVEVQNFGAATFDWMELVFFHKGKGVITETQQLAGPGPAWKYNWLADPPGPYRITATVSSAGCTKSESIDVAAGFDVGCCLSPPQPDLDPVLLACVGGGNQKCASLRYEVINNNCLTAVSIERMGVTWVDNTGNKPNLTGVAFDGTLIWNVTPPAASPATNAFSDPKPSIDVSRDSTNPVIVHYLYDDNMAERQGLSRFRNTLTTTYDFRLLDATGAATSITGSCGPAEGMFDNLIVENP